VQDTLLEAQRDIGHFQGESEAELLAWLRRLLLTKRRLDAEVPLDAGQSDAGPAGAAPSPSDQLLAKEHLELVRHAMGHLPEDYRRVLTLWYEQELSFEEIGREMQRSPNAARMLWMRAIERLQGELETLPKEG